MPFFFYDLPAELRLEIFNYLGSRYFRTNVSRLCVSRLWYEETFPVFAKELRLRPGHLLGLVEWGGPGKDDRSEVNLILPGRGWLGRWLAMNLEAMDQDAATAKDTGKFATAKAVLGIPARGVS